VDLLLQLKILLPQENDLLIQLKALLPQPNILLMQQFFAEQKKNCCPIFNKQFMLM